MTDNTIDNGGFETGDINGWSVTTGGTHSGSVVVSASYANDSSYGAEVSTWVSYGSPTTGDWVNIERPFTCNTGLINIHFDLKMLAAPSYSCRITCELRINEDWYVVWSTTRTQTYDAQTSFSLITISKIDITEAGVNLSAVDRIRFRKETQ
jgi:hypothetical protein